MQILLTKKKMIKLLKNIFNVYFFSFVLHIKIHVTLTGKKIE